MIINSVPITTVKNKVSP